MQKADEQAVILAETGSNPDDMAEFENALKFCRNSAERRAAVVSRIMLRRGKSPVNWTQKEFDGAFNILRLQAAAEQFTPPSRRVLMGNRVAAGSAGSCSLASPRMRMLAPMRREPQNK